MESIFHERVSEGLSARGGLPAGLGKGRPSAAPEGQHCVPRVAVRGGGRVFCPYAGPEAAARPARSMLGLRRALPGRAALPSPVPFAERARQRAGQLCFSRELGRSCAEVPAPAARRSSALRGEEVVLLEIKGTGWSLSLSS